MKETFLYSGFPLGVLFGASMALVAILAAYPPLMDEWLWWAGTLAVGLIFACGPLLFSFLTASERKAASFANTLQSEKPISADAAALVDAISRQESANRSQEKREELANALRETITIFVLIFTAVVILRQVAEMVKVYQPIRDQANASVLQEKSEISAERARIFVAPNRISPPNLTNDRNPKYSFSIANLGRTAALIGNELVDCNVYDRYTGIPIVPIYNKTKVTEAAEIIGGGISNANHECTVDHSITDDEIIGLKNKTKIILFKGYIVYRDIFGNRWKKHFGMYGFGDGLFYGIDESAPLYNVEEDMPPK